MYNLFVSFTVDVSVVVLWWFHVVAIPGSMRGCSPFSIFFPNLMIIFIITITARTTQRLSKRSAKQQKVIQPRAVPVLSKRSAIY